MTERERQRGNRPGKTAETVAQNVKTFRYVVRRMTQAQLASATRDLGRPIPVSMISKIEHGLRRVDVDDLVTLAEALQVEPFHLLNQFSYSRWI